MIPLRTSLVGDCHVFSVSQFAGLDFAKAGPALATMVPNFSVDCILSRYVRGCERDDRKKLRKYCLL